MPFLFGFNLDAMLRMTGVELELLADIYLLGYIEKSYEKALLENRLSLFI